MTTLENTPVPAFASLSDALTHIHNSGTVDWDWGGDWYDEQDHARWYYDHADGTVSADDLLRGFLLNAGQDLAAFDLASPAPLPSQLISSFNFRREQDEYGGTEAARKARNYEVFVSPTFAYCGREYQVVLNGHWALAAAIADGVAPTVTEVSSREDDSIGLLTDGRIEDFLEANWSGGDWHDAITGVIAF